MQVIFCTDGIFPHAIGGMQRHSRLLIEELAKFKDLQLIVIHPHAEKIFEDISGITEISLTTSKTKNLFEYLLNAYKYSKQIFPYLLQYKDAVIYSQGMAVWYGISKVKNRLIVNPHGLEPYQALTLKEKIITAPYRFIHNHIFRNAAKIISLGGRLTNIFTEKIGIASEKIAIIPNAAKVPEPMQREFNRTPLQFLFVGRFADNKGIQYLIEAALELNKEGYADKFKFAFVGKGPLYDSIINKYKEKNLIFHGGADDAALFKLYKESDAFILPTLFEGMPTVILEAMGYGLPIIVTDTGATLELVDESNGWIIEKKNVKAVKSAILAFANLPLEEKRKRSEASYKKLSENFTWPIVAQKHYQLFKSIGSAIK